MQIASADVLEAGFVDELFAVGLRVAELHGVGDVVSIRGLGGKRELTGEGVGLLRLTEGVTQAQRLDLA